MQARLLGDGNNVLWLAWTGMDAASPSPEPPRRATFTPALQLAIPFAPEGAMLPVQRENVTWIVPLEATSLVTL